MNRWRAWVACLGVVLGGLLFPLAAHAGSPIISIAQAFGSPSIAVNASTSLTFTVTNALGGTGATSGAFTDNLPAGLVVATPNGLTGTCLNAPQNGNVTATAGSGTISLANMTLNGNSSCTLAVNVTGTTAGTKSNNVSFSFAGGGGPALANAVLTVTAAATPTQPIPNLNPVATTPGIGRLPTTVDLSKGEGPTMTVCLVNAVKAMEGMGNASYRGQDAFGVASIDLKDGRYLSFFPLSANTDSARTPGLYFSNNNRASLATSCGSFDISPAVFNLAALGRVVGLHGSLNFDADGVATFVSGSLVQAARPDFVVTTNKPASEGLVFASGNGVVSQLNDGAGNAQLMRTAVADPTGLSVAAAQAGYIGTLAMTVQGTFVFTPSNGGGRLLLTPLLDLQPVTDSDTSKLFWLAADGRLWYRYSTLLSMAQGFLVTPL